MVQILRIFNFGANLTFLKESDQNGIHLFSITPFYLRISLNFIRRRTHRLFLDYYIVDISYYLLVLQLVS